MAYIPQSRKAPHDQRRKPFEGWVSVDAKFYNSVKWRRISKYMAQLQPLCVYCLQKGLTVPSTVTDHIQPIQQGGDRYDIRNLQRLCDSCHNQKTALENKQLNQL
jgi:5-methylcytosine-specific restriction protein A